MPRSGFDQLFLNGAPRARANVASIAIEYARCLILVMGRLLSTCRGTGAQRFLNFAPVANRNVASVALTYM